ncbi:MAG: hypothetical protein FWD76_00845 [Firmicutes bacterium]|nr:hypothetical protein [Bacillota bacterium]
MKSVKSTQGVESAKSTWQGWLARMTKKRWVAVVALLLCFVFCMSFGISSVLQSKKSMLEPAHPTAMQAREQMYGDVIAKTRSVVQEWKEESEQQEPSLIEQALMQK